MKDFEGILQKHIDQHVEVGGFRSRADAIDKDMTAIQLPNEEQANIVARTAFNEWFKQYYRTFTCLVDEVCPNDM